MVVRSPPRPSCLAWDSLLHRVPAYNSLSTQMLKTSSNSFGMFKPSALSSSTAILAPSKTRRVVSSWKIQLPSSSLLTRILASFSSPVVRLLEHNPCKDLRVASYRLRSARPGSMYGRTAMRNMRCSDSATVASTRVPFFSAWTRKILVAMCHTRMSSWNSRPKARTNFSSSPFGVFFSLYLLAVS
uniref:Uncharacterized protein n=1 Tax=Triticum urartu TaxID=4572 RepID=A0A8R7RBN2_TRIUA